MKTIKTLEYIWNGSGLFGVIISVIGIFTLDLNLMALGSGFTSGWILGQMLIIKNIFQEVTKK